MRSILVTLAAAVCLTCGGPGSGETHDLGREDDGGGGVSPTTPDAATGTLKRDLYESGTRIKAHMLVTPDGAKQFWGWRDTQLGVDCSFYRASDGRVRCLPNCGSYSPGVYFANAACTEELTLVSRPSSGACAPPPCLFATSFDCSGVSFTMRDIGSEYTGQVYQKSGVDCIASPIGIGYAKYHVGPERSPAEYVEATERLE